MERNMLAIGWQANSMEGGFLLIRKERRERVFGKMGRESSGSRNEIT